MKVILDNNIVFAIMRPQSSASYLFWTARNIEWLAPNFLWVELKEYEDICLAKSGMSKQEFEMLLQDVKLKIKSISLEAYKRKLNRALILTSDPDDAPYLALALVKNATIWSNDKEYTKQSTVRVCTTKELIEWLLKGVV